MKSIKIYTTSTCYWCQVAKEFFKKNRIKYKEIDVTFNPIAQFELIKKSRQIGVPVLDIDGQIIIGFDRDQIEKALSLRGIS